MVKGMFTVKFKMMNRILLLFSWILLGYTVISQNEIEWDGVYELQITDFKSNATKIGNVDIYSMHTGSSMGFSYQMSAGEFMFTKNFNSRVYCTINQLSASLVAPDSIVANDLLNFARYEFDLSELYARKFRKRLFEEKRTFSSGNFFDPIFDEIQHEYTERHAIAATDTDLGRNKLKLNELHNKVLEEISELSEYCKSCKPPKKKKNK